jgi:hypothetical protein
MTVDAISIEMIEVGESAFQSQVDRILHSEELRSSDTQRRLLKFLADKSIAGEADALNEYAVATDGLGKSSAYDPRHNSAVRIQVGRLRQSLAEYYRTEGKEDDFILDLPKGRFKLTCVQRVAPVEPPVPQPPPVFVEPAVIKISTMPLWGRLALAAAVFLAIALGTYVLVLQKRAQSAAVSAVPGWSPDLQQLWGPFVDSKLPLILTIEDPLFAELRSQPGMYFRDRSLNQWSGLAASPAVGALQHSIKTSSLQPSRYYTAFGEVEVAYHLGVLLGPHQQNLSIIKTSQVSLEQLADNNVIFVGVEDLFFDSQLHDMPLELPFVAVLDGIRNVHPQPGEPAVFPDAYSTAPNEEGVAYALVTHLPGPLRSHDIISFTSNRSAGYLGAIRSFTDPTSTKELVAKLKGANGEMPRFYQILFKVRFKDDVPLETTYILSRKLQ